MPKQKRRFVVAVAPLRGDRGDEMRRFVIEELRKAEGALRLIEAASAPQVDDREALRWGEGRAEVEQALAANKADLLIWGEVIRKDGASNPRLYMATSSMAAGEGDGVRSARYEGAALPAVFWKDLGDILTLVVLARASAFDGSRYQVKAIEPFLERVRRLVDSPSFGKEWASDARWGVLDAYGSALRIVGEQAGDNAMLEEGIAVHKRALEDAPRERVPLDWAGTQSNLGNALKTLGERESGTKGLEEAVAAYREALKEYTRERVPLYWAGTQGNLGSALRTLAERQGRAPCEAVEAHLGALEAFSSVAHYYARRALSNLRKDLSHSPAPTPTTCPTISQKTWERVTAAVNATP